MKRILLILIFLWGGVVHSTTITSRVSASADDAYSPTVAGNGFTISSGTLYVGLYYGAAAAKTGLRFNNITIPPGSTINTAAISGLTVMSAGETQDTSGATVVKIAGEDTASAAIFTDSANFNARTLTTARSAQWTIAHGQTTNTQAFTSVDCASVIQEIVDRGDWSSGASIVLMIVDDASTQHRRIRSYDGDSPNAPLLTIDYTVGGGPGPSTTDLYIKGGVTLKSGTTIR